MIEIIGLYLACDDKCTWRVKWPESAGDAKGSSEFDSCELAVQFALLIRTTMHINEGRRHQIVVLDEYDYASTPSGGGMVQAHKTGTKNNKCRKTNGTQAHV